MNNVLEFNELFLQLNNVLQKINLVDLVNNLNKLTQQNLDYKNENNKLKEELKQKDDELKNLTKVSMIQNINKQLREKDNLISILEEQLKKKKIDIQTTNTEQVHNYKQSCNLKVKNENIEKEDFDFNPDLFNDINGYELIMYKKKYYLKDMETNEIYDILNNQPNKVIGLINLNGKIKIQ